MRIFALSLLLGLATLTRAQHPGEIVVKANQPGASISSTMWGIFFEDINMAADGGLYAELVKNRSFEFNTPLMGWKEHSDAAGNGTLLVINRSAETPANPRYIRITHLSDGAYGISNEGFRGMGIKQGETYHFSLWDRTHAGTDLKLHIELAKPNGEKLASARLPLGRHTNPTTLPESFAKDGWNKDTISLTATATEAHATLYISIEGRGSVDMDMISLFPEHTWKQRPGGLRSDLVQWLADMKPGFVRFPGGCIVEGRDLANRYQWKNTVGAIEDRRLIINRWNTEFAHRLTPDYFQSFGLGFFEYFQLAEDIGAEPLPILNCGMACQFNTAELVSATDLDPYIQDALDLIEFANGDITTKWGALRQSMGHPKPFQLKMLGVGNEQWGPQYVERYPVFEKAIHTRYPNIRLVNSVGPEPDDKRFQFLNDTLRKLHADILDEHYYRQPDWFLQNARRYDRYDRKGPAIFAGEYAAQSDKTVSPANKNNWQCALAEAAYMTGLERNADVVRMASYAPLFAHAEGWQWTPDLIWFDNLHSYGTPDYYVQKLYSTNRGSIVLPALLDGQNIAGQDSLYASATLDTASQELILKLVNVAARPQTRKIRLEGASSLARQGTITVLKSAHGSDVNSFDNPMTVSPIAEVFKPNGKQLELTLPPASFTVLRTGIFL